MRKRSKNYDVLCKNFETLHNHFARRELACTNGIWLDAGNGFHNGQVVIGNSSDRDQVLHAVEQGEMTGRYRCLPSAALLFPDLLEPEPPAREQALLPPEASCAALVEAGSQHLLINDLMGSIMAHYCYKLLTRSPVHSFATFVDGDSLSMRSLPVNKDTLLGYLPIR